MSDVFRLIICKSRSLVASWLSCEAKKFCKLLSLLRLYTN